MKITDMMLDDIRAEIEFKGEVIIVKNAKGETRLSLLEKLNEKLMNESGYEDINIDDLELMELLLHELTNIDISDEDDVRAILSCPCEELSRVSFYLASILQELMFEVMASKNLLLRNQEFLLLQEDTLKSIDRVNNMIDETMQRCAIRVLSEEVEHPATTNTIAKSVTPDENIVSTNGK